MTKFRQEFAPYDPEGNRAYQFPSPSNSAVAWELNCVDRGHPSNLPPEPQDILDRLPFLLFQ